MTLQANDQATQTPASSVLALDRICLDFQLRQDRYRDSLGRFLKEHQEQLGFAYGQEDLVQAYLDRVWPDDLPGALIVANISRLRHSLWLIRPPVEGPLASSYAAGGLVPAFRVYRRQATLVVVGVEIVPHARPRPFEVLVTGRIRTLPSVETLSAEDINKFEAIPRHRQAMEARLAAWLEYLDWKQKLAHLGQLVLNYDRVESDETGNLCFHARAGQPISALKKQLEGAGVLVAPASASQDQDRWDPPAGKRPPLISVGTVQNIQAATERSASRIGKGCTATGRSSRNEKAIITVVPWDDRGPDGLPETGFLLANIGGEIRPIAQERTGIERLCNGQGHNPYLLNWIFDGRQAAMAEVIPDVAASLPPTAELNPQQREAINKALAAPDCCLIQGPPGTGKTWVIVWICYWIASRGGRVLVASQTNLAVDNVLSRLPGQPELRPLRIAKADRVDEAFRNLLEDKAAARWLTQVAQQARQQIQEHETTQNAIREAQRGFEILQQLLTQATEQTARIDDLQREQRERQQLRDTYLDRLKEAQRLQEASALQQRALHEMIEWLDHPDSNPPIMEQQVDAGMAQMLQRIADELRSAVAGGRWTLPGMTGGASTPAASLLCMSLAHNAATAVGAMEQALAEALSLCRGASGSEDSAAGRQLRELHVLRGKLMQSEREEDLVDVARINREIRSLREDRWAALCQAMLGPLNTLFNYQLPIELDELTTSLQPNNNLCRVLEDLQRFCIHLRETLLGTLAKGFVQLKDSATAAVRALANQKAHQAQIAQVRQDIQEVEAGLDELQAQLEQANDQLQQYESRWAEVWPSACVDLASPSDPPGITPESLRVRRAAFEVWQEQHAAQRDRDSRWHSIQQEWVHRLENPVEATRQRVESLYVQQANVIGMTCYEAGQRDFYADPGFRPFDVVIIDEASKVTPSELLLPALLGRKVILVGDHRQLSPMFRENENSYEEAVEEGLIAREDFRRHRNLVTSGFYETLFEIAPDDLKQILRIQYRMHLQVMRAVNLFYDSQLEAGPSEEELDRRRQHQLRIPDNRGGWLLEPHQHLLWIDSSRDASGRLNLEQQHGTSKANALEAELVVAMLLKLNQTLQEQGYGPENRKSVGVITFYGAQLNEIRQRIARVQRDRPDAFTALDLRTNTVDRFQGMECAFVIVSLVRSVHSLRGGDYVRQYQRINVAFSRAQELLVVIGSERTFREAVVALPSLEGGIERQVTAYRDIYEIVKHYGGRRYARQVLG